MTGLDVIYTNRRAYQRKCRRHNAWARLATLLRCAVLLFIVAWCFNAREELSRSFDKTMQAIAARR